MSEETSSDAEVKCPVCGELNRDLWEYSDAESGIDFECGNCDAPLILSLRVSHLWKLRTREVPK